MEDLLQVWYAKKKFVNLWEVLYKKSRVKVKTEDELSDRLLIETGVQQDEMPSSILFNLACGFTIRKILEKAVIVGVKFSCGGNDFFILNWRNMKNSMHFDSTIMIVWLINII